MHARIFPFLSFALLAVAAPPTPPTITRLVFSGSGCPNDSGSVTSDTTILGDSAGVSFSQLKGDSTNNCGVHIQSSGASPGWQVALKQADYAGNVELKGNSGLNTLTQVFWSENAGDTVSSSSSLSSFPHLLLFSFPMTGKVDCILPHSPKKEKNVTDDFLLFRG